MHAGGQRFDPAILHQQKRKKLNISSKKIEFIFNFFRDEKIKEVI